MKLYNTITGEKEEVTPLDGKTLKIYVCGPTVYNLIHIGNARTLVVFDTLRRYLKYRGQDVFYVQNFTDVDDKIIRKANATGQTASEVAEAAIADYFIDAESLNIIKADVHPKVTETMDEIISVVQSLVDSGHAYVNSTGVYFKVDSFRNYGSLSKMPLEALRDNAGGRIPDGEEKNDPMDFAVWKTAKPGEPMWDSPFGAGRPGWHIECSAMARRYIGETLDIHGGGADLIFPHHENECAQSECANGKPLARMWVHSAMLFINNEKMAKSKGNFKLVREIAEEYGGAAIRFMLLSANYRSQMNFNCDVMDAAKNSLKRISGSVAALAALDSETDSGDIRPEVAETARVAKSVFIDAMDDDLNTANGLAAIFDLVRQANTLLSDKLSASERALLKDTLLELTGVLGLDVTTTDEIPSEITLLADKRAEARQSRNFALADTLKKEILDKGFTLEDTKQGTIIKKK
ncbi:MAG: cysteine--tRNA ligase [Oscillospiraceae bacterium]|jgi:cysteinyl-tRNA synthetase|nr:cysteine--tRNA ligase [Oscillospiraceae bacterium]